MEGKTALFCAAMCLMMVRIQGGKPTLTPSTIIKDAGSKVSLTCTKAVGDTVTKYEFFIGATPITGSGGTSEKFEYTAKSADNGKDLTCKATVGGTAVASDAVTLAITAVPAPTISSVPAVATSTTEASVDLGKSIVFTCTKASTAKGDAISYKFFEGTNEITTGTVQGNKMTLTATTAYNTKVIKCQFFNGDLADEKKDSSNTITMKVVEVPEKCTIKADNTDGIYKAGETMKLTCEKKTGSTVVVTKAKWYNETKNHEVLTGDALTNDITAEFTHEPYNLQCACVNTLGEGVKSDVFKFTITASCETTHLVSATALVATLIMGAFLRQ